MPPTKQAQENSAEKEAHLEDLAAVRGPRVAEAPGAVLVAVEDADPAVDGARREAVAVGVERDGLDQVPVAVLKVEIERRLAVAGRRRDRGGHDCGSGVGEWQEWRHPRQTVGDVASCRSAELGVGELLELGYPGGWIRPSRTLEIARISSRLRVVYM